MAAATQAGIGNVAAGSLFAGAQSVAAGGALPTLGYGIAATISAVTGGGAAAMATKRGASSEPTDGDGEVSVDEAGLDPKAIDMLMTQTGCSRAKAVQTLRSLSKK